MEKGREKRGRERGDGKERSEVGEGTEERRE